MFHQIVRSALTATCLVVVATTQVFSGEQPLAQDAEHFVLSEGKGILSRDQCGYIYWSQNSVVKMAFKGASLYFTNGGKWVHVRRAGGGALVDFGPYDEHITPGMNLEPMDCGGLGEAEAMIGRALVLP